MKAALLSLVATLAGTVLAQAQSPPAGTPIPLFDGRTLEGWDFDPKIWRVEDGMITGGSSTEKIRENHFICTKKSYQNFDLSLKIKCSGDPATGMINSGIQIRSVRVPGGAHMSGYQVDCGKGWFGRIYDEFRRNRVIAEPVDAAALEKVVDVYGWNEYRILAEGPRIRTWINGVLAIDYTETDKNIALDGQIGPQVHSGGACLVQVKDISLRELPATPGAPTWESLGGVEAARKLVAPPPKPKPKPQANAAQPKRDLSYNTIQGTARSAAEQQKLFRLPPGFEIELVAQESPGIGKFVSVYFDQRGRLWTQTALEYPVDANENPAAAEAIYAAGRGRDQVLVFPRESVNGPIPEGGLARPTVFADRLAIPLGILPWGAGDRCYVQHGHDLKLFKDTDGDGKADSHEIVLTGFGVQDSHLFPHQFTRAPGGWIWMAQGLFNNSKVHKPGSSRSVDWPKCSMARLRADGDRFEVTSTGPNNIWGLTLTGEGEAFIQEANDYGYPVMPFHEYAYYPGGMEALKKSYQPDFPPTASFRMGGTGLSGLALGEGPFRKLTPALQADGLCMIVANPIISRIQTIAMHRDGPWWKLEPAPDLVTCDDPFFRPVALTNGPDGSLYIVDWYNKIISHNEVPRSHPDRDKTRGRIWRVKPSSAKPGSLPDFTRLRTGDLIALLGTEPAARAHLAWQTLADRLRDRSAPDADATRETLARLAGDPASPAPAVIQALWCLEETGRATPDLLKRLLASRNPRVRREAVRALGETAASSSPGAEHTAGELFPALGSLVGDDDPSVRAAAIQAAHRFLERTPPSPEPGESEVLATLLTAVRPSLPGPTAPGSRGPRLIPIREAYDREFERFLVRFFLERHPETVARFLDSDAAAKLGVEPRILASLALPPKTSAPRIARLLSLLDRAPNDEELLRLAEGLGDPAVDEALAAALGKRDSRENIAAALLRLRTRFDAARLSPMLARTAREMLDGDERSQMLALQIAGEFQFAELEAPIARFLENQGSPTGKSRPDAPRPSRMTAALRALGLMGRGPIERFATLVATEQDPLIRREALAALASSKAAEAGPRLIALWNALDAADRRLALERLTATKPGARAVVAALKEKTLQASELDAAALDRLHAVLGPEDPDLAAMAADFSALFRPVLRLDGDRDSYVETGVTLDGAFTVETWVKLDPGIGNEDGILGSPGQLDMNFFAGFFRVWVGGATHDAIVAKKRMAADNWTHLAVTRDAGGRFRIFIDGEPDPSQGQPATQKFEKVRAGWTQPAKGTQGMLSEFRIWNRVRSPEEIRNNFDRGIEDAKAGDPSSAGLVFHGSGDRWPGLRGGARVTRTSDLPPLVLPAEAAQLDEKFARYRALASRPGGDPAKGRAVANLCLGCHLIQGQGGNLAPNISGAATMGIEALLRNLITPNAAMEAGYRIFRVEMKSGDLVDAFLVSEDPAAFIVRQPGVPDRRIPRDQVRSAKFIRRSLMPEGMLDALPAEMVTDLFSYLMTLKG